MTTFQIKKALFPQDKKADKTKKQSESKAGKKEKKDDKKQAEIE